MTGLESAEVARLAVSLLSPLARRGGRKIWDKLLGPRHDAALVAVYEETLRNVVRDQLPNDASKHELNHAVAVCQRVLVEAEAAGFFSVRTDEDRASLRQTTILDLGASESWLDAATLPLDIHNVLTEFAIELPARIRHRAEMHDSDLFEWTVMQDLLEVKHNLQLVASTTPSSPSGNDRKRRAVLRGDGLPRTLEQLYPRYPLVQLFGLSMPICIFPAPIEQWSYLEATICDDRRERRIPNPDVYPSEYWPGGAEEVAKDVSMISETHYNDPTYALDCLTLRKSGGVELKCKMGWYFWSLATTERLDEELMRALAPNPDEAVDLSVLRRREWLHEELSKMEPPRDPVLDGNRRSSALSVSMTIVLRQEDGTFRILMPPRSGRVTTHPFFNHVAPSGIFQPFNADDPSPAEEFSVRRVILREYVEELYDDPRYRRGNALSTDPERESEVRRLKKLIEGPAAELLYSGVSVNLLTLRPEICTVLFVKDHTWLNREIHKARKKRRPLKLGWEYLETDAAMLLDSHSRRQPFLGLDAHFEPIAEPGSLGADVLVPNAAGAIELALRVGKIRVQELSVR